MSSDQLNILSPTKEEEVYWSALFLQEQYLVNSSPFVHERQIIDDRNITPNDVDAKSDVTWQVAIEAFGSDRLLQLPVTGFNKGGLLVSWHDLQGFVPASQLVDFPLLHVARERLRVLAGLQGNILELKIIEVNPQKNRLILSERAAHVKADQKVTLLQRVRTGDIVPGRVTNLTDFGAFVDLGGVEGLIHISELSWSRVTHPSHIVQPGQEVQVLILNVDQIRERVGLSYKRLKDNPWCTVEERYKPGDLVSGVISNVVSFGAFVLLEEELEGLIHITELAEGSFLHPRNVVRQGDQVTAQVLQVDGKKKRLALTLRSNQTSLIFEVDPQIS